MRIELYEDGGGGLSITTDIEPTVYSGFQFSNSTFFEDAVAIRISDTDDWTVDEFTGTAGAEMRAALEEDQETRLIALYVSGTTDAGTFFMIYPHRCGFAGREYLGLPEESL